MADESRAVAGIMEHLRHLDDRVEKHDVRHTATHERHDVRIRTVEFRLERLAGVMLAVNVGAGALTALAISLLSHAFGPSK